MSDPKASIRINRLSDMLSDIVLKENYLNKDSLSLKFRALIRSFRLDLNTKSYLEVDGKGLSYAQAIRNQEISRMREVFWQREMSKRLPEQDQNELYKQIDKLEEDYNKTKAL